MFLSIKKRVELHTSILVIKALKCATKVPNNSKPKSIVYAQADSESTWETVPTASRSAINQYVE